MTNFSVSMKELEALAAFANHSVTGEQLTTLLELSERAKGWLFTLHAPCATATQPKKPA